jgi:hypothetical protein
MGLFDPRNGFGWYYQHVALAFLLLASLWVWLIRRRQTQFSTRLLFIIVTSFAVIAAIAGSVIRSHHP